MPKSSTTLPPSATVLRWLKNNGLPLGALTGHDTAALQAATQIASLWLRGDHENRPLSQVAFSACVRQMQPHTRFLAFHATAHAGDWNHRVELWTAAGLELPGGAPDCTNAPRP